MSLSIVKSTPLLQNYIPQAGAYDEMWAGNGTDEMNGSETSVHPHWRGYLRTIEQLGPEELGRTQQEVLRLLKENGVSYNVHGDPNGLQRPWALDAIPLIISEEEWAVMQAGLVQRAELLNLILADVYGPRELFKRGLLPLELVFSHSGFLRPCDGVRLPGTHQLIVYAADLARDPDGQLRVLSDQAQAPSGAGYALENRTVMARVLGGMIRDCKVLRLANFFRELHAALADLAAPRTNSPRIVVLTPGPHNETYFEHAYLASYLGYSLVQGDDLTVHDGKVWLKSLEGLQPVDVILRRVDGRYCDPLELRDDSRLGVAGLLEASRRQNVAVANPLGSSVLENPGLLAFLPALAKYFLGEELRLPSAATWWCGQPKDLDYVLQHLDQLVIKTISRQSANRTMLGFRLSKAERETLVAQIKADPYRYVGQEQVHLSTTPSLINNRFEARHAVLRGFLVARNGQYTVMPGGLTRSATEKGNLMVSNQAGGISKDTWVLTSEPQRHISLWLQASRIESAFKSSYFLPSRAAENLFWVGRYTERAEATARLLRTILKNYSEDERFSDEVEAACLRQLLYSLTYMTETYPGFIGKGSPARLANPKDELLSLLLAGDRIGSVVSNLNGMARAAYAVRDLWSTDTWRVLDTINTSWSDFRKDPQVNLYRLRNELNHLITTLMAFAGLSMESMTHEAGWLLLDMGRRLERGLLTIAFIRSTLGRKQEDAVRHLVLEGVLTTTDNVITYRRRYRSYLQTQTVLDLLLLDERNPRSLAYQINTLQSHLTQLPRQRNPYRLSEEERLILDASTRLRLSDTVALTQAPDDSTNLPALDDFMQQLSTLLSQMSQVVTERYFSHAQAPHQSIAIYPEA